MTRQPLHDPDPFVPDAAFRQAVYRRAGKLRHRRRLARAGSTMAVLAATTVVSTGLYVRQRDHAIDRVQVSSQPSTDGAVNILLVGSDEVPGDPTRSPGARADTIAVVRLAPDGGIDILSVPRDLLDPATDDKLSLSLNDGPDAVVDAVTRLTGIPIDHYVEVQFAGLEELVDAVGGLRIRSDVPLVDRATKIDLPGDTCLTLDGPTTLRLLRSRQIVDDPASDPGRTARQRAVLRAAFAQLAPLGDDPAGLDRLSRILADHARLDDDLTLSRLIELGRRAAAGSPAAEGDLPPLLISRTSDGIEMLVYGPGAGETFTRFGAPASGATPAPPAGATPVVVTPVVGNLSTC